MNKIDENFQFEAIIREIEKELIKIIVDLGSNSPLSPKLTEILGYLLLHDELTQAQLKELTGFSIGTISSNLNQMVSLNIVRKELIPKTRTYKYIFLGRKGSIEMQASFMKVETVSSSINFFEQKHDELLKLENEKGYDLLNERVESMLKFFQWHKKVIIEKYKKLGVMK
ncbi:MAG: hypothetical protein ACFFA7_00285 [Promethearchaeota archaeon]